MHMLRLKIENKTKEMAVFWVIRPIKYASLEYELYKNQNIKVDYKINILDKIMNFLKTKNILSKYWVRNINAKISILLTKNHIRDQIDLIDNEDEKE